MVINMACTTMTTVTTKVRPKAVHISMCRQAPPGLPLPASLPGLFWALLMGAIVAALLQGCVAGGNQPMQLIHDIGPTYPEAARAAGAEGWVKVRYDISAAGLVENPAVVESDPAGLFDAAALAAVAQWRYRPAIVDGAPKRMRGVVSTLRFQLDGGERYDLY